MTDVDFIDTILFLTIGLLRFQVVPIFQSYLLQLNQTYFLLLIPCYKTVKV